MGDPDVASRLRTFVPNGIALVTEAKVLAGKVAEDPDCRVTSDVTVRS